MGKAVQQGNDAAGIREDLIPFLEDTICRDDNGSLFIASVDDLIEKISSVVVIGQVAYLVNAK